MSIDRVADSTLRHRHRLRIDSVRATSEAGSGHRPAASMAGSRRAVLRRAALRSNVENPASDRFVLSKGTPRRSVPRGPRQRSIAPAAEAAPDRLRSRRAPTPRLPFVDVATGSLGQGICAAISSALNAADQVRLSRYVLMGDNESAEGSVWEAADVAAPARQPVCDHRRQRARPGIRRC
jgi:transketolase